MQIKILIEIIDGEEAALLGAFSSKEEVEKAKLARQSLPLPFPREWQVHEVELDVACFQFVL